MMNALSLLQARLRGAQPISSTPPDDETAWLNRALQGGSLQGAAGLLDRQQRALPEGLPDVVRQSILNQPSYSRTAPTSPGE